jgi:hypothetical protein
LATSRWVRRTESFRKPGKRSQTMTMNMTAEQVVAKLAWVEGPVVVKDGVLWLPDGSQVDLLALRRK